MQIDIGERIAGKQDVRAQHDPEKNILIFFNFLNQKVFIIS